MTMRSSRLVEAFIEGAARSTSASRTRPSGVNSKAQAEITAGMNPIASRMTTVRIAASDRPNTGNNVSTTWISSQLTAT